jgi:hypothetical protein
VRCAGIALRNTGVFFRAALTVLTIPYTVVEERFLAHARAVRQTLRRFYQFRAPCASCELLPLLARPPAKPHVSERDKTGGDHEPQNNAPRIPADEPLVDGEQRVPQRDGEVPPGEEARAKSEFGQFLLGQYIQR